LRPSVEKSMQFAIRKIDIHRPSILISENLWKERLRKAAARQLRSGPSDWRALRCELFIGR
ncbi:hypothetical protein R2R70_21795, partial [Cobetia sp. SIMBA_158]|uniref:hypothetical protein n=1 Tax=Cobetia sp. SIMBA_158 TaxID=3081617 RepID=UPI00397F980C